MISLQIQLYVVLTQTSIYYVYWLQYFPVMSHIPHVDCISATTPIGLSLVLGVVDAQMAHS